jgi:hypothetical protein
MLVLPLNFLSQKQLSQLRKYKKDIGITVSNVDYFKKPYIIERATLGVVEASGRGHKDYIVKQILYSV